MVNIFYKKKRAGMSGIYNYFYETKLLSLINFRAIHDDTIEEFYLATNVNNIGSFSNICFKATVRGHNKPVAAFIQVEHRINKKHTKTLRINYTKCYNSYLKIRQRFKYNAIMDPFFGGTFEETECLFVIFTNADVNTQGKYRHTDITDKLYELLGAGGMVKQVDNDVNIEYITKLAVNDQIISLAQQIARFINDNRNYQMMLVDELVLRYHVVLAQKVVDVSDIQPVESKDAPRYRIASFRQDFFDNNEEYIMLFRDTLYLEIIKRRRIEQIGVSPSTVNKAVDLAAKKSILSPLEFKVPVAFGNKDLTLNGSDAKIDKRIRHLTQKIIDLLEECKPNMVVTIDESLGAGFLKHNGGIAGAIGNIFVLDDNTKLMKITDNCDTLETIAKRMYTKLNSEIKNLHEYKFSIKVNKLPKLSFDSDCYEENLAKDFLSKLLFCSRQSDQTIIENVLKNEIEKILFYQPNQFEVQTEVIFLRYYDEIQKWYLFDFKLCYYLYKKLNLFRKSMNIIVKNRLLSSINLICKKKIQQHDYTFTEDAVGSLYLDQRSSTIIVAENCVLTVVKLLQHLNNKKEQYLQLDYDHFISLSNDEMRVLLVRDIFSVDLNDYTKIKKKLIFVIEKMIDLFQFIEILEKMENVFNEKNYYHIIIITNENSFERSRECLPQAVSVDILHDKKSNLIDMCEESQKKILETASAVFPGVEIRLDHFLRGWNLKSASDLQCYEWVYSGTGLFPRRV